jgi:hypothetical protein
MEESKPVKASSEQVSENVCLVHGHQLVAMKDDSSTCVICILCALSAAEIRNGKKNS